jgi:hypothetical protein
MEEQLGSSLGRLISVADAGHNVLLEEPTLLADVIARETTRPLSQ